MTRTQFVAVALLSLTFSAPLGAQRPGRVLAGRRGQPTQSQAASRVTLAFQGRRREYLLHVPTRPNGALLLAFHGGGETPENQEEISGFDALSDREGFIVAYPAGIDHSWADGRGTTAADRQHIDDVGFTRAVVADIARSHRVDSTRVYATGPSNGGIFVSRLGCDASDLFAGIAPVIGTIASALTPQCHPARHLTVVGIQGVADPVVPFDGGDVGGSIENA
ncbi:MAG TPA: PHB depolymerase family esterase, partial [Gemmatimonadaceae bacterium]